MEDNRRSELLMCKTFCPYDPEQQLSLPAAWQEWLLPEHLVYFISDVVDQLDLSAIAARYQGEDSGGPPYHLRMMLKVLLYGYCIGVVSSRRIVQLLPEDIAFRVLAANNTPDFRKDHLGPWPSCSLRCWPCAERPGWLS
ncbi:MAG: transposase [Chloroflexota bacterium]|nr:transposase [Chloroflexota bacterium]